MPTGKDLKKALRNIELSMEEIAEKLGVSRGTLYNNFKKEELEEDFVQLVQEKLGIDLNAAPVPFREQLQESKLTIRTLLVPLVPIKAQAGYIESHEYTDFIEQLEKYPMAPGINPRGAEWRWSLCNTRLHYLNLMKALYRASFRLID